MTRPPQRKGRAVNTAVKKLDVKDTGRVPVVMNHSTIAPTEALPTAMRKP